MSLYPGRVLKGKVTFPPPMWPVYEATLSFGVWGPRKRGRREKEWLYIVILKLHARFHGFSVGPESIETVLCWQWGCGCSFIFHVSSCPQVLVFLAIAIIFIAGLLIGRYAIAVPIRMYLLVLFVCLFVVESVEVEVAWCFDIEYSHISL